MKVQCPQCKRLVFKTTLNYDPARLPNASMIEMLDPWKSWGWDKHHGFLAADLSCPLCEAPLAPSGRLHVVPDDHKEIKLPPTIEEKNQELIDELYPMTDEAEFSDEAEMTVTRAEEHPSPFTCPVCGKVFKNKFGLTGHMRSHKA